MPLIASSALPIRSARGSLIRGVDGGGFASLVSCRATNGAFISLDSFLTPIFFGDGMLVAPSIRKAFSLSFSASYPFAYSKDFNFDFDCVDGLIGDFGLGNV